MSSTSTDPSELVRRPKRADARRNYEKLLTAAREVLTEADTDASLEEIARRAGVGIGTLYRHFPTRQNLLEAVYVDEVEAVSRSAQDVADLPPWDALVGWLRRFVGYLATKHALADELFAYGGPNPEIFASCRSVLFAAGAPLLERAQQAGIVRDDVDIDDVLHIVNGIAKLSTPDAEQRSRLLDITLDGLRKQTDAR
jgi:AcrR family transcriptional regulator